METYWSLSLSSSSLQLLPLLSSSSLPFKLLLFLLPKFIVSTQICYLIILYLMIIIKKIKRERKERKKEQKRGFIIAFFYYVSLFDFNYTCFTAFTLHLPSITTLIHQLPAMFVVLCDLPVGHFRTAYSIFISPPGYTATNQST